MSKAALHLTDQSFSVRSPNDGSVLAQVPLDTEPQAFEKLARARAVFDSRKAWLPKHERIAILRKAKDLLESRQDDFAMLIAEEGGKPLADAKVEAARAVNGIEVAIEELNRLRGTEIPMGSTPASAGRQAHTIHEPIGVVLAVCAFNHPLNLAIHQVVPAVATGCPVILKPAETTPLSSIKLIELLHEAGLPEAWAQVCICELDVTKKLVSSDQIDFLTFIGSAKVGWSIRSNLAPGVRCALEHGGTAPAIIDATADLEASIPSLAKGAMYHSGQVCVSVQRVYAEEKIAKDVAKRLAKASEAMKVGDAREADTECGPLIRPGEVDRVEEWVEEAKAGGADVMCGGARIDENYYKPTVLLNPAEDARVTTQEIFGPVVCVYSYKTLDEAIERANGSPFSFQAAVYSNDDATIMRVTEEISAAAVMVNDHTAFRVDWMPFAGHKQSGYGVGGIGYTMEDMLQEKLIVRRT